MKSTDKSGISPQKCKQRGSWSKCII